MPAKTVAVPVERLVEERLIEVGFPCWPPPFWVVRAVATAAPRDWATEREAGRAAAIVAAAVGIPSVVAVGAVVATVAVASVVLLAPIAVAIGLAWLAWRWNRVPPGGQPALPTPAPPLPGAVLMR
jgi:hypothetical protein